MIGNRSSYPNMGKNVENIKNSIGGGFSMLENALSSALKKPLRGMPSQHRQLADLSNPPLREPTSTQIQPPWLQTAPTFSTWVITPHGYIPYFQQNPNEPGYDPKKPKIGPIHGYEYPKPNADGSITGPANPTEGWHWDDPDNVIPIPNSGPTSSGIIPMNNQNINKGQAINTPPLRFKKGGIVPGKGNDDSVPALLTPGERVLTKKQNMKYEHQLKAIKTKSEHEGSTCEHGLEHKKCTKCSAEYKKSTKGVQTEGKESLETRKKMIHDRIRGLDEKKETLPVFQKTKKGLKFSHMKK